MIYSTSQPDFKIDQLVSDRVGKPGPYSWDLALTLKTCIIPGKSLWLKGAVSGERWYACFADYASRDDIHPELKAKWFDSTDPAVSVIGAWLAARGELEDVQDYDLEYKKVHRKDW